MTDPGLPSPVAAATVEALVRHGVDLVFGIPGTHNLELYRELGRLDLRHVTPRHEQGAGYAADGYARAGGRPGVSITTSGPGLTNICTATATSWADSIPTLVIAPGMPDHVVGTDSGHLHEIEDQFSLFSGVVSHAARVSNAADATDFLDGVFDGWKGSRQRPAYLEIPLDVLSGQSAENDNKRVKGIQAEEVPALDGEAVARVARAVDGARRVCLLLGGGSRDAYREALSAADALGAAVATSVNGKGVVSELHELSMGATLDSPDTQAVLRGCDVLIVVGSEVAHSDLAGASVQGASTIVRVDVDRGQLSKNLTADIEVVARATDFLRAIAAVVRPSPERRSRAVDVVAATSERNAVRSTSSAPLWTAVNRELSEHLPDETIVAGDSAQVSYLGTIPSWPMSGPRRFLYPTGYSTLGYGLPAAIGAALAKPGAPVVVLQGDGGFQFSVQELFTAAGLGLGLPIIVMNNGGYAEIREQMIDVGISPLGTDIATPDLARIATAAGGLGRRTDDPSHLPALVLEALQKNVPTVVEFECPE